MSGDVGPELFLPRKPGMPPLARPGLLARLRMRFARWLLKGVTVQHDYEIERRTAAAVRAGIREYDRRRELTR